MLLWKDHQIGFGIEGGFKEVLKAPNLALDLDRFSLANILTLCINLEKL